MSDPYMVLVEDDPDDEELILRALARSGIRHAVVVARDGNEALELLARGRPSPRVVVIDLKMPLVAGINVVRRLRAAEHTASVPVVVLTSSSEPKDVSWSYAAGANSYVQKPVAARRFGEVVVALGMYWLHYNEVVQAK